MRGLIYTNPGPNIASSDLVQALEDPLYDAIRLTECTIAGDLTLITSSLRRDEGNRFLVGKSIECDRCVFNGHVHLTNARFERGFQFRAVTFRKRVDLTGSVVSTTDPEEVVAFHQTMFEDQAVFTRVTFESGMYLSFSTFEKVADLNAMTFLRRADFTQTTFKAAARFSVTSFHDEVSFKAAAFDGQARFIHTMFPGEADFAETTFGKPANFEHVQYWPDTLGQWWLYHLRGVFWRRRLKDSQSVRVVRIRDRMPPARRWLRELLWRDVAHPTQTSIYEPRWLTRRVRRPDRFPNGRPTLGTQFVIDPQHIYEPTNPLFKRHVADQQFVRSFCETRPWVGRAWRWSCDYGRSAARWVAVSGGILLGSAWAYGPTSDRMLGWLGVNPTLNSDIDGWVEAIYFSVVTFATLGFGDITPTNAAGRVCVVLEVLGGYAMLGLLVSVFASRLLRRS